MLRLGGLVAVAALLSSCSSDPGVLQFIRDAQPAEVWGTQAPSGVQASSGDNTYLVKDGRVIGVVPNAPGTGGQFLYLNRLP